PDVDKGLWLPDVPARSQVTGPFRALRQSARVVRLSSTMAASSSGDRRFSLANLIFALASSYGGADCSCCGMWYRSHVARSNPFHFGLVWARSFNRFPGRFGGLLGDPIHTR